VLPLFRSPQTSQLLLGSAGIYTGRARSCLAAVGSGLGFWILQIDVCLGFEVDLDFEMIDFEMIEIGSEKPEKCDDQRTFFLPFSSSFYQ